VTPGGGGVGTADNVNEDDDRFDEEQCNSLNSLTNNVNGSSSSVVSTPSRLKKPSALRRPGAGSKSVTATANASSSDHLQNNTMSQQHSVSSPGSMSGRSSTSSLNNVHAASTASTRSSLGVEPGVGSLASPRGAKLSVQFNRKVSINEHPVVVVSQPPQPPPTPKLTPTPRGSENGDPAAINGATGRASLIEVSERKARKVRFFINADKFFKGAVIAVSGEKFRTFDRLLEHMSRIMCNQVTLPSGVRYIFALDGRVVEAVNELLHGENYVCSSTAVFKKLDYLKMTQEQEQIQQSWKGMKRDTYYLGMGVGGAPAGGPGVVSGKLRRDAYKMSGHSVVSKSFGTTKSAAAKAEAEEPRFQIKPKIIAVLRSGLRPRKAVRVLLNNRNTKSFDIILADLTSTVKLDTGAVRKVFTLEGKPVVSVVDFAESEVFIAYGVDKCSHEDFDLDLHEFRNIQSILKSPELDTKYSKFASVNNAQEGGKSGSSPKSGRRKFPLSRNGVHKRNRQRKSPSKTREGTAGSGSTTASSTATGNTATTGSGTVGTGGSGSDLVGQVGGLGVVGSGLLPSLNNAADFTGAPTEITHKYVVGEIIGDGNFAVVRRCVSKRTRHAFALKIIDKSKCQGKEHMIESEIAILNLVSHPHIIELIEVFDFFNEKYLVTELVPGGDLFDAIAVDTKYSEPVSRRMVSDLTSALQYLHDKMIVHRDIKPENLLVVKLDKLEGSEARKSLKLGDFGLAQLVSEPLYTVCGTPTYVAPEILAETGYGVKVDVWATGVIMYILLVGFPPFSSRTNNQEELFDQILSGLFEFNSPDWDEISYPAKELISLMLQVDPLQRYSAYEILQHPWIRAKGSVATPNARAYLR